MMFSINPSSGTPIYMQIVEQVRQYAVSGRLKAGDPLPSVRTIARELDINHMTVSKAYSLLRTEGVVVRIRGKGMVVSKTSVDPLAAIEPQVIALVETVKRLGLGRPDITAVVEQVWSELEERNEASVDEMGAIGTDLGATS